MQIPGVKDVERALEHRGPPDDVSAGALFRKCLEVPAPSEVFDFPRRGVAEKVRMVVLDMDAHDTARLRAEDWLSKRSVTKEAREGRASREVLADRIAREVVAMSAVSEKPIDGSEETGAARYSRWFASADDVSKLTPDEVNALFTAYVLTQHRYGPHAGNVADEAEQTAWIQRLTEGASANPLAVFTFQELAELTCGLAKRAYSCCAILDSLRSSLPDTLASELETWGIGTPSRGWPAADASVLSALGLPGATSEPAEDLPPVLQPIPSEPLTMGEALKFAETLRKD